jgi:hypothetical protein
MPRADDRAARVLARTQEVADDAFDEAVSAKSSVKKSVKSSRMSERIVINDQEMDIDRVVQKVRERLSSPGKTPKPPSPITKPEVPSPRVLIGDRNSERNSERYVERPSPKSPAMENRLPVTEVREIVTRDIIPEPMERKVSPALSYETLKRSTREEVVDSLKNMNSQQLRDQILKMRSERSQVSKRSEQHQMVKSSVRQTPQVEKIPVFDQETGTWILYPKSKLIPEYNEYVPYQDPQPQIPQPANVKPPLFRRGTTRDAYPTKTFEAQFDDQDEDQPQPVQEETTDIDFDTMNEVQRREFLDEMKMKFAVLKKNYPDFPIPVVHDDDNPKWVFGIYEQLLDMAKGDASQPIYQTGLQVVFLILQVVLSVSGIPAKDFFTFHSRHFSQYNKLMVELGEKWGPIIDVTSSTETKLALAIGWNTVIFAVVSVVASKFGDRWGTSVEQILNKITTSTNGASEAKMEDLRRQMDGREEAPGPAAPNQGASNNAGGGDMMGGLASMLGGLLGGGGNGGGGLGNLLGGLLGGAANMNNSSATSTERKPPTYDD